MKNLTEVKEDLKEIQGNFNPEKSTYNTINDVISNNYSANEIISILSKIKGVSKYPDYLKNKLINVIDDLKLIEQDELKKKEEEKRELERKKQEAKTKELKDIIDTLEKDLKKSRQEKEEKTSDLDLLDEKVSDSLKVEEVIDDSLSCDEEICEDKWKTLFRILLVLVIVTFLIAVLLFLLY